MCREGGELRLHPADGMGTPRPVAILSPRRQFGCRLLQEAVSDFPSSPPSLLPSSRQSQKRFFSVPLKAFSHFLRSTSHLSLVRSCACCSARASRGRFLTCLGLCSWQSNHNVADTCNCRMSGQMNECANKILSLEMGVRLAESDDAWSE